MSMISRKDFKSFLCLIVLFLFVLGCTQDLDYEVSFIIENGSPEEISRADVYLLPESYNNTFGGDSLYQAPAQLREYLASISRGSRSITSLRTNTASPKLTFNMRGEDPRGDTRVSVLQDRYFILLETMSGEVISGFYYFIPGYNYSSGFFAGTEIIDETIRLRLDLNKEMVFISPSGTYQIHPNYYRRINN